MIYRHALRPLLFLLPAERAHATTLRFAGALARVGLVRTAMRASLAYADPRLEVRAAGLTFANPIGLGAGIDKSGTGVDLFAACGFGFTEVGSVSRDASAGNRTPHRLWRLRERDALLVNYGVPNDGIDAVVERLRVFKRQAPLGVNLVETNRYEERSASEVIDEIRQAAELAAPLADYLTINLQCPNSAQGPLAQVGNMQALLRALESIAGLPPVFLKTPATTDPAAIDRILGVAAGSRIVRGIVPVVVQREPFPAPAGATMGSVTGSPTREAALQSLQAWYRRMDRERLVLVGGGGVFTGEDAYAFLQHGATLVQIATALVYQGPGVVRRIEQGLLRAMDRDGVRQVQEVVGAAVRPLTPPGA